MKRKGLKRKPLLGVILLIAVLGFSVGVTTAFLLDTSGPVENEFKPSKVTCYVEEEVESGKKKSVTIENTGDTDAYIRVAVIANSVKEDGGIVGAADVSNALAADGWTNSGNYYYWLKPVKPGDFTDELLKNAIDLKGLQVTILAEAIQSEPTAAVEEAWGFVPGGSSN